MKRLVKVYKLELREVEFEEHRINPKDCFPNTRKNIRDMKK